MMRNNVVIAIDGPSASGKGTLTKKLSEILQIPYLCTGNLYRHLAKLVIDQNIDLGDIDLITEIAKKIELSDLDEDLLQGEEVAKIASIISPHPLVRNQINRFQQNFIAENDKAILEGRDIATVICPDAKFKFFITASLEERARRRYHDMVKRQPQVTFEEIRQKLQERDNLDTQRKSSPLLPAQDAIIIDTSDKNAAQTTEEVLKHISF